MALCAPGSELAMEQRGYPSTALEDLSRIEAGKINDTLPGSDSAAQPDLGARTGVPKLTLGREPARAPTGSRKAAHTMVRINIPLAGVY